MAWIMRSTEAAASTGAQILSILHELAHMVYKNGKPIIVDDGGGANKSSKNTAIVETECGDAINEFLKK